jgi:adenosylhomocysteine nucleosidase
LTAVGIVAALAAEAQTLGPTTQRSTRLATREDGSLICVSGVGASAAERAGRALIEAGALGLISWGVAGGLDPGLAAGTLLLPAAVVAHGSAAMPTHAGWREGLATALGARLPVSRGLLLSSGRALVSVKEKAAAFAVTGAVAVDMESFALARLAAAHRLPFIIVRAVVDVAADAVPPVLLDTAIDEGRLRLWRLLLSLAGRPAEIAALARLALRFRAARRTLREAAGSSALAVPSPP